MVLLFAESLNVLGIFTAIYAAQKQYIMLSAVITGIAMGFKMVILLYIPAVYYIASKTSGIISGTFYLVLIGSMQLLFAYPFLTTYPDEYVNAAFNFTRRFSMDSSMNFNWITISVLFESKTFANVLLLCHFVILLYFLFMKWLPLCHPQHKFSMRHILKSLGVCPIRL